MMKILLFFSLILVQSTNPAWAKPKKSARKPAEIKCPDKTSESMTAWRDKLAQIVLDGDPEYARLSVEDCFGTDYQKIPTCVDDVYDYAMYKLLAPDKSSSEHRKFIEEVEAASLLRNPIQKVTDLPQEFWVPDPNKPGQYDPDLMQIPANIEELAKRNGWYFLPYRTRSAGGFDRAPNLTLVAIPNYQNKPIDVYLQISPPPQGSASDWIEPKFDPKVTPYHEGQDTLTMIVVDKRTNPPEGFLKLNKKGGKSAWQFAKKADARSCISCHTSPALPISPRGYLVTNTLSIGTESFKEKRMAPEDVKTTTSINNMMTSVNDMAWARGYLEKTIDGTKRMVRFRTGPPMDSQPYGWAPPQSATRKEEFLKKCIAESSAAAFTGFGNYSVVFSKPSNFSELVRPEKLKTFMNCTQCHNGTKRGYLHSDFSMSQIRFRVLADRSMPPFSGDFEEDGSMIEPNMNERLALVQCLKAEREDASTQAAWKKSGEWMKVKSCFPTKH